MLGYTARLWIDLQVSKFATVNYCRDDEAYIPFPLESLADGPDLNSNGMYAFSKWQVKGQGTWRKTQPKLDFPNYVLLSQNHYKPR